MTELRKNSLRTSVIAVPLLLLGGCILPPAVTVASLALDSLSYLGTGKGLGDNALSLATQRDCALERAFTERNLNAVCRLNIESVVAALPRNPDAPAPRPAIASGFTAATPAHAFVPVSTAAPAAGPAQNSVARSVETPPVTSPPVHHSPSALALGGPKPAAPDAEPRPAAAKGDLQAAAESAGNRKARYLVVGSFRVAERAETVVKRLTGFPAALSIGIVDSNVWFRVAVGPYAGDELDDARTRLAAAGIDESWPINLCTADLNAPPCAGSGTAARETSPVTADMAE
ncbi:MAG: SPOR domain-containing protein [Alphaproteobacteria bacterium]